ncbi:MAG: nitrilase-related carbon-nitrogen hydrolase [Pseudomonadota bacterium]
MGSLLRCGLVQADIAWQDPAANRAALSSRLDALPSADFIVLPETCMTGFEAGTEQAESMQGDGVAWLIDQARARQAAVAAGLLIREHGRIYNRLVVAMPDGRLEHYDKRHLFSAGGEREKAGYSKGVQRHRLDWHSWRIDLQICYDLRFPVWCRNHASEDHRFDLQIFVANWPSPRVDAWLALLKARAIENQAVVIGVNRTGVDGKGIEYPGQSAAFDANGQCLAQLGSEPESRLLVLDRDDVVETRQRLPFLPDRDSFNWA